MMTMLVNRVFSVRAYRPMLIGEKLVLWRSWPIRVLQAVPIIVANHLLQKNDVCLHGAQLLPQVVNHAAAIERGNPFVDVVRRDAERFDGSNCTARHESSGSLQQI